MRVTLLLIIVAVALVGCGKNSTETVRDGDGSPAGFIDAVAKGDIEAVKKHLADGADVNVGSPLNVAIESRSAGRKEIVELLLAKGSDVNAKNNRGWPPAESLKRIAGTMLLVGATDEEKAANNEIATILLQHGAKPDADFKHFFPTQNKPTNTNQNNNTSVKPAKKKMEKETPSKGDDKSSTTARELTPEEKNPEQTKSVSSKLIADPIVENAIREEIEKFTGELTKADLKKVRELYLVRRQLTDVKGLGKLTQLTLLYLEDNPALTKAQIAELQKALPKCKITHTAKK